jgi:hypothetical protein
MSLTEVCQGSLECFLLKPGRLVVLTKFVEHRGEITFGFKRSTMIRARMSNTTFQHFALNRLSLLQLALLEQDFAEGAEEIDSNTMVTSKSRGHEIEGLIQ